MPLKKKPSSSDDDAGACANCERVEPKMSSCARCGLVFYCGKDCQGGQRCRLELVPYVPRSHSRGLSRLFVTSKKQGEIPLFSFRPRPPSQKDPRSSDLPQNSSYIWHKSR